MKTKKNLQWMAIKIDEKAYDRVRWDFVEASIYAAEVVECIISIPPPMIHGGPDSLSWSKTTSGVFSVKSAYFALKEESWHPQELKWSKIWKIPGPLRVKHFVWLVLKQRLLTNSERVRRGIEHDVSCHLCGHFMEDTIHILRYCSFTKEIWL
ncbi:hypothetical protein J1N35_011169 [Gossypium stocksii]|uniref:Reverse transcriptase zinc-binding domain-containing protein n=1 Tax=Gossypium stocksii TaxID=47602 RepID=A0A9D4ADF3_9ROSI|nr:hypothetical protein J1N35_011169 [Gossypium stocksii]